MVTKATYVNATAGTSTTAAGNGWYAWSAITSSTTATSSAFTVYADAGERSESWASYSAKQLQALQERIARGALLDHRRVMVRRPFEFWKPLSQDGLTDPSVGVDFRCGAPDQAPVQVEGLVLLQGKNYVLPDGAMLRLDSHGNYSIRDVDAKVIYQDNRLREFNPYINASDLLEHFIKEVGQLDGVHQMEVLRLPIEAFINWIILQAARKDGDSLENLPSVESALPQPALPPPPVKARCASCGRFIRQAWYEAKVNFCSHEHMLRTIEKVTTTPGIPARSKWNDHAKISVGQTHHGEAMAAGVAGARA